MITALLALAALAPDAGAPRYTEEQLERCGPNIEQLHATEARGFRLAEEKAIAVDEARRRLRMCLDLVAAQPFDAAQRAARAKCPCKLADLAWSDDESKDCREPIEGYYRYGRGGGAAYVAGYIDDIRSCLLRSRAARARAKADAEDEAELIEAKEAEPVAPVTEEAAPDPTPPEAAAPKSPQKIDRKGQAARRAARLEKQREIEEAVAKASEAFCGPAPQRSAWDGIYVGLKRGVRSEADDPDSVDFEGCTALVRKNPPICWATVCRYREKNSFGAKALRTKAYGKNKNGWYELNEK